MTEPPFPPQQAVKPPRGKTAVPPKSGNERRKEPPPATAKHTLKPMAKP